MKKAKKAHVISHTHWDREWYLPYERHHMLEVEFMDRLLKELESGSEFKSFHLDGQTIMLDDYLQVRPEKRELVERLVREKRLYIGPWYILQDEWLTGSESNVRNLSIGMKEAEKYGGVSKIGYFPDSFGNMGQAPQLLLDAGIDTAAFGRGVKPTGFNNEVSDGGSFESRFSELFWESPDGSRILGVLFANWYNNGAEIPVEEEAAKRYWERKLADAARFAATNQLLFMNGCDHQPVQTDLPQALETARKLCPEVEFVHSNFTDYMECLKKELREDGAELAVVKGELRSQETDGWYTLANTASSRIYLKQWNARCESLFAKTAEPLAALACRHGMEYPHRLFDYGWKTLMQNHPHDSICGCSVDEVHREMVARFEKAEQVALHLIDESMSYLAGHTDVSAFTERNEQALPFLVVNPAGYRKAGTVELTVPVTRYYFKDIPVGDCLRMGREDRLPGFRIVDEAGNEVPGTVEPLPAAFGYDLPKDRFRESYFGSSVKVTLEPGELGPFSWKTFALVPIDAESAAPRETESLLTGQNTMENEWLRCRVNENGTVDLTWKETGKTYREAVLLEDTRDVGNEYIYHAPEDEPPILSRDCKAAVTVLEDLPFRAKIRAEFTLRIPVSADERLENEVHNLVEFRWRKAGSAKETLEMPVSVTYTLNRTEQMLRVELWFDNQAKDHRLRMLCRTGIQTDVHYADSIFEAAKRSNRPSAVWENPCNAQHQQLFVNLHDASQGLTVANQGLNEYEILPDEENTVAVTLHRGVREVGDWGVFPAPEAQCLGEHTVEFALAPHGAGKDLYRSYETAYSFSTRFCVNAIRGTNVVHTGEPSHGDGGLPGAQSLSVAQGLPAAQSFSASGAFLEAKSGHLLWSGLTVREETGDFICRWFNPSEEPDTLSLSGWERVYRSNVLGGAPNDAPSVTAPGEKEPLNAASIPVAGFKILTLGLSDHRINPATFNRG